MGRGPKEAPLQREHTDGQQTYDQMLQSKDTG